MRAGSLDRYITIKRPVPSQSGTGEVTHTYTDFAQVWARRVPKGGRKYFAAQQVNAEIQELFEIRYLPGLDRTMRISFEGEVYEIVYIEPIGRDEGFLIGAKVLQANG